MHNSEHFWRNITQPIMNILIFEILEALEISLFELAHSKFDKLCHRELFSHAGIGTLLKVSLNLIDTTLYLLYM